jgi:glycosyltransferase involved in cell wall biosynthesis
LKHNFQRSKVTINGTWPNQPPHCLTFENPCLTTDEVSEGISAACKKQFDGLLSILFVGRIETAKGVDKILTMAALLKNTDRIKQIVMAGDGSIANFQALSKNSRVPVIFTGGIDRKQLNALYSESHILLLPSVSEGFPKVVAEASAYGCVPFVSNVSSLSQYIHSSNGHLFSSFDPLIMTREFEEIVQNSGDLKKRSENAVRLASKFTYSHYNLRILREIIQPHTAL